MTSFEVITIVGLVRNLGGIGNYKLYEATAFGTKKLIDEYSNEVVNQLNRICDSEFEEFSLKKKFDFFYEARQTFGRSALLLRYLVTCTINSFTSGGSTLGMYHLGVVKALHDQVR